MPGTSRRPAPTTRGGVRPTTTAPKPGPVGSNIPTKSVIDIHKGNMLVRAANTYPTLPRTILEGIQNGFDADADRVLVLIDMKSREVLVLDNGTGTTLEQFQEALFSVGESIKDQKDSSKMGRFGLGLISPLTKCTNFSFTSSPRGRRQALRWTFRREDIGRQRHTIEIPVEQLPQLPAVPRRFTADATGEFGQNWRTIVHMRGVTTDRVTSSVDLDDLAANIQTKFQAPMRDRKGMVRLVLLDAAGRKMVRDVSPLQYTGEALPVVSYDDITETGRVTFELYRARRIGGSRKGKVSVMEGRGAFITMQEFVAQARGRGQAGIIGDAMTALMSGYFEGIIRCEGVELHEQRNKFVYNDALESLYLQIDRWYDEYGKSQYRSEQDLSRQSRWQEYGLKTLEELHVLRDLPQYAKLFENLQDVVQIGRLGEGHLTPAHGKVDGPDAERTKRVGQGGTGVARGEGTSPKPAGPRGEPKGPRTDRPGDIPKTSSGPEGQDRTLVKGDSQGLNLAHAEWQGDSRLWDFDFRDGTLTFNTLHTVWLWLDETNGKSTKTNEKWILHLQKWLTLQVLTLLLFAWEPEEFEHRREFIDGQVRVYAEQFIVGKPRTA